MVDRFCSAGHPDMWQLVNLRSQTRTAPYTQHGGEDTTYNSPRDPFCSWVQICGMQSFSVL